MTRPATALATALAALGCALPAACRGLRDRPPTPTQAGLRTADIIDPAAQAHADQARDATDLGRLAGRAPPAAPSRRSVLVLSGGGAYGAYPAGVLVGWSACGRPAFDTVTGISTGALMAPFAFLGPRYDPVLEHFYGGTAARDLYRLRPVRALRTEAVADIGPLTRTLEELVTPGLLREIAAEHRKGRRLYVGTTELESRRQVVWDLGEIACRGTPEDLALFRQVLLASAAIPGFFPPQHIPVEVDGVRYDERHIDGGVSASLFFRPPELPPDRRGDPAALAGTDVFALVAGKVFPDPAPVRPRALSVARRGVAGVLYSQTRNDLVKLYALCGLTRMHFFLAAIPPEVPVLASAADFEPEAMAALFAEGARRARDGTAWRATPPGAEPGEGPIERSGTRLTQVPVGWVGW